MFVIARKPELMRAGPTWHLHARDAFYLTPTSRTTSEASEEALDKLLDAATKERPRELVACGWFVRATGRAWSQPELIAHLRAALLDGPAALTRQLSLVPNPRAGLAARARAAWAVLTGRTP